MLDGPEVAVGGEGRRAAPRPRPVVRWRWVRFVLAPLVIGLLTVEVVLLAPHLKGARAALAHVDWSLLLLAVAAEGVSMLAFAALYKQMLRGGELHVPLRRLLAMVLAANALSATLPAGSALASGYSFQRMRRLGASAPLAGWALVISGLVSGAAFAVLGVTGALFVGTHSAGILTAAVAVVAAVAAAFGIRAAARRPDVVTALGRHIIRGTNRLLRRDPDASVDRVQEAVANLVAIRPRALDWLIAVGCAALNWAADIACLVLACHAVGITDLSARTVLIAYAADAAVGTLQLLPGGIGTVDAALVLALVNGGVPAASAAAGVLIYRLISFVLAAIVGWIVWLVIRERPSFVPAHLDQPTDSAA